MLRVPRSALFLFSTCIAVLGVRALAAATAPPKFDFVGVDTIYFSPNGDHVQDQVAYFFDLSGDSARVRVVVHPDAGGSPGTATLATLLDQDRLIGPDTLTWDGRNNVGSKLADGLYWISASARNSVGSDTAATEVIIDTVAPRDSVVFPSRSNVTALVHHIDAIAYDKNRLESFVFRLEAEGKTYETTVCAPCLTDSTRLGFDVPDSLAQFDTLTAIFELRDPAGNQITKTHPFFVDSIPPPTPVLDPIASPVDRPSVVVTGQAPEAESVFVSLDGLTAARRRVEQGGSFSATLSGFLQGTHTVVAQSEDRAKNASPPSAPVTFVYQEPLGIVVPERFRAGDFIQVNLTQPARSVTVTLFTLSGRLVRTFESTAPGTIYEFAWDLKDDGSQDVGSGPYVLRAVAENADGTRLEKRLATVVTR